MTRKSTMTYHEVYFWIDTIKNWKCLLKPDKYKEIIIDELRWLKERNKISIYGFVIMPNHLHMLWEMHEKNGKEAPASSFKNGRPPAFLKTYAFIIPM